MKKALSLLLCLHALSLYAHPVDPRPDAPVIQLALLLDTSNSMDGLIDQAKSQLWRIVNDMASSQCRGHAPRIEVALYEYGNTRLAAGEGYLRQVLPFTDDLDRVSEKLFALRTSGGEEYCGAVIKDAVRNLNWSAQSSAHKTIFIAGNEPFTQGEITFREEIRKAVDKDIVVNTLFCGDRQEGIQTSWKAGADLGRGGYFTINQDQLVAVVRSPYDDEIERLGRAVNDTYVFYGVKGKEAEVRRGGADRMAEAGAPAGASVERSIFKSNAQYSASLSNADAVSGVAEGRIRADELKQEELPAEFQGMGATEMETVLQKKNVERQKIQKELDRLAKKRQEFLAGQAGPKDTLDKAVLEAVRSQASPKGFTFSK